MYVFRKIIFIFVFSANFSNFIFAEKTETKISNVILINAKNCKIYYLDIKPVIFYKDYTNTVYSLNLDLYKFKHDTMNKIHADSYPIYKVNSIENNISKNLSIGNIIKNSSNNKYCLFYSILPFKFDNYSIHFNYKNYTEEMLSSGFLCLGKIQEDKIIFDISDNDIKLDKSYCYDFIENIKFLRKE